MAGDVNRETGERTRAVEKPVSIAVGSSVLVFSLWFPPYIADALKPEDWLEAGKDLRRHRDRVVTASVYSGDWFKPGGEDRARDAVQRGMAELIYERFKARQVAAGNSAWSVPSLLLGERFAV